MASYQTQRTVSSVDEQIQEEIKMSVLYYSTNDLDNIFDMMNGSPNYDDVKSRAAEYGHRYIVITVTILAKNLETHRIGYYNLITKEYTAIAMEERKKS